jgi:DNA-binding NarL/FixJ family response regulator
MTVRILLAEDQPMVRAGLAMLLTAQPDIEVVGEASDGAEAVTLARDLQPDVVLMDLRMPGTDGVTATRILTEAEPATSGSLVKVLVLTTFKDDELLYSALRAGASGYLLKHAAPQELVFAVRKVAAGESYVDPAVAGRLIAVVAETAPHPQDLPELVDRLTPREREVLVLMADGLSNQEVRDRLHVSEATVKTHVARIIMKTGSRDRTAAVVLAYKSGLVRARPPGNR